MQLSRASRVSPGIPKRRPEREAAEALLRVVVTEAPAPERRRSSVADAAASPVRLRFNARLGIVWACEGRSLFRPLFARWRWRGVMRQGIPMDAQNSHGVATSDLPSLSRPLHLTFRSRQASQAYRIFACDRKYTEGWYACEVRLVYGCRGFCQL